MVLKVIGLIFIAIGAVDLIGSWSDFDLWTDFIGVNLPEVIWRFTAYIELGIGFLLFKVSGSDS